MNKLKLLVSIILLLVGATWASGQTPTTTQNARRLPNGSGAPTGACVAGPPFIQTYIDSSTTPPTTYYCKSGTWTASSGGATAAPKDATYITQTPNATLTNEQALSALATGIPLITTTTGVISISSVTNDVQTKASIVPNTAPSAGQLLAGNAGGTAYAPVSLSGDATLASTGALTLASTISAGGPTGSATVAPIITYDAKGRLTTVSSATITPAVGSITGFGTGIATWLATPSSANLRSALTDELGTGAALFDGATPTSFVLTNATGLPLSTGVSGTLAAAQEPAHTGDVTNSAGSLALTIAANAVSLSKIATQATNTVLGNATSGTAVPTALAVGTCSTAGSALIWTTNTGFGCNTSITANTATTATTATNATNTAITDDTTTNATMYPTWVTTTTGNLPQKVSSSKLTFNPSTGTLTTTTVVAAVTGTASGNMTAVSVATANGVSGSSSGGQTPALTITLGAITPTTVAATDAITASASKAGAYIAQFTNSSATGFGVNIQTTANNTSQQVLQVLGNAGAIIGLQVRSDGHVFVPTLSTDSGATDTTACVRTSDGELLKGSGTLGICLGTSSARFKTDIKALPVGLAQIMALQPVQYYLDEKHGDPNKLFYGFTAERGGRVLPALMGRDANGLPNTFDYLGVVPVLTRAFQELTEIVTMPDGPVKAARILELEQVVNELKRHD